MPKTRQKYVIAGVDVYHVRNRNEQRVAKCLNAYLESAGLTDFSSETIKDIYAYTLNNLTPRYTQQGTIVLRDPVRTPDIEAAIVEALEYVLKHPK